MNYSYIQKSENPNYKRYPSIHLARGCYGATKRQRNPWNKHQKLYGSHRELYFQFNKVYDKYPVLSDIVGGTWY